jgi:hypothetical protein
MSSGCWSKALLGAVFWGVVVAAVLVANRRGDSHAAGVVDRRPPSSTGQLIDYWRTPYRGLELRLPSVPARDGDPIFIRDSTGRWLQAGFLTWTDDPLRATEAKAVWHLPERAAGDYEFVYHHSGGDLAMVVRTLFPPATRERIEALIRETLARHGEEVTRALRPLVVDALRESLPILEESFRHSLAEHESELRRLGVRYETQIIEERLLPLVKAEVLPIVRRHGEPVAKRIGRELWDRASLWRFAWRGLYDKSPLPDRDLLGREWQRYLDEEAVPVVEKYTPALIEAQKQIFLDLSANERIRAELTAVAGQVAQDRQFQQLLARLLRDTFVENERLHQVWMRHWQSERAQAALRLAGARIEPLVRRIGDEIFGTREGGVSPQFARVLRNQILGKDRRWIVAVQRDKTPGRAPPLAAETSKMQGAKMEGAGTPEQNREPVGGWIGTAPSRVVVRVAEDPGEFPMIILAADRARR